MKSFIEVVLVAAAILLFAFGYIPASIFVGMFAAILFIAPERKPSKTPEELMAEAKGDISEGVHVEYSFCSKEKEIFTADLHYYSNKLDKDKVLDALVDYVTDHTGIKVTKDRLHIVSMKPFVKE